MSWQVWSGHHQVPVGDVTFLHGPTALKPEEIAAAIGISCMFLRTGAIGQDTLQSLGVHVEEEVILRVVGTSVSVQ